MWNESNLTPSTRFMPGTSSSKIWPVTVRTSSTTEWMSARPSRATADCLPSPRIRLQPLLPGGHVAVEDVDVGVAADARNDAGSRVLPEGERVVGIFVGRVAGDGAQPV